MTLPDNPYYVRGSLVAVSMAVFMFAVVMVLISMNLLVNGVDDVRARRTLRLLTSAIVAVGALFALWRLTR